MHTIAMIQNLVSCLFKWHFKASQVRSWHKGCSILLGYPISVKSKAALHVTVVSKAIPECTVKLIQDGGRNKANVGKEYTYNSLKKNIYKFV